MKNPEELLSGLREFTGTTKWYKHSLFPKFSYTDGVKYLATNANCYWLIEYIFSNQLIPEISRESYQTWKLEKEGSKATIIVEDGNYNIIKTFKISFTDFPLDTFKLWLVNKVLLLPSEY